MYLSALVCEREGGKRRKGGKEKGRGEGRKERRKERKEERREIEGERKHELFASHQVLEEPKKYGICVKSGNNFLQLCHS